MMISIHDVPTYERPLLFCTDARLTHPELDGLIPMDELGAVNRSLAALGEQVDDLIVPGDERQPAA